mgnify:CR=1 FL=1
MDLNGKVALVTGGAVRVGRSIALALAAAGADISFSYCSSADAASATADEIRAQGRRAFSRKADFKDSDDVKGLVESTVSELGRLDILVNSAAFWLRTPWATLKEKDWDNTLDVTLRGPIFCAKYASPHLAEHGDGLIVNIVDLSAFMPFPGFSAHSAAKAGLLNATYGLAVELAPAIRVNAIAPGLVLPPPYFSEAQTNAKAQNTLLRRWGTPEDVAMTVIYFAHASYVTGTVIHVDGGERLIEGGMNA